MNKVSRNASIECLRIITMIMIVFIHAFEHGGVLESLQPSTWQYNFYHYLHSLCQVAVNCYILISGYYLVNSKYKSRRLIKIFFCAFFWSIVIYLIFVILGKYPFEWKMLLFYCFPIGNQVYWYVTKYLVLLIFIPYFNMVLRKISIVQTKLLIYLLLLIFSIYPFLFNKGFLDIQNGREFTLFVLLYFIGAYIRLKDVKISKRTCLIAFFSIILIVNFFSLYGEQFHIDTSFNRFLRYNSPFIVFSSCFLFLYFRHLEKLNKCKYAEIFNLLGGLTFGVYLIHNHPICQVYIWVYLKPNFLIFLIYGLAVFCICVIIEYIRVTAFKKLGIDKVLFKMSKQLDSKLNLIEE